MRGEGILQSSPIPAGVTWHERPVVSAGIGVAAFAVMTALGAHVRIPLPFTPVPITLQSLFVHLAGATLGPVLGPVSQVGYLVAGVVGIPVFAGGASGPEYLLRSVTTGYLLGFVLATGLVGRLIRRREDPGILWILGCMAVGSVTIYSCGVAWLCWSLQWPLTAGIAKGVVPFLVGDALKGAVAACLFRSYRGRTRSVLP